MHLEKKYKSFWRFYPYYLTEHGDAKNRLLHFIGTGLIIILQNWWLIAAIPFWGYGFAWVAIFYRKKRPATFTYPLYSLGSDLVIFWHILTGQLSSKLEAAKKSFTISSNEYRNYQGLCNSKTRSYRRVSFWGFCHCF